LWARGCRCARSRVGTLGERGSLAVVRLSGSRDRACVRVGVGISDAVDGARSRTGGRRLACGVTPGRALRWCLGEASDHEQLYPYQSGFRGVMLACGADGRARGVGLSDGVMLACGALRRETTPLGGAQHVAGLGARPAWGLGRLGGLGRLRGLGRPRIRTRTRTQRTRTRTQLHPHPTCARPQRRLPPALPRAASSCREPPARGAGAAGPCPYWCQLGPKPWASCWHRTRGPS
jgi:hypothetical protein